MLISTFYISEMHIQMHTDGVSICTHMHTDTHVHTVSTSFNDNGKHLDIPRENRNSLYFLEFIFIFGEKDLLSKLCFAFHKYLLSPGTELTK